MISRNPKGFKKVKADIFGMFEAMGLSFKMPVQREQIKKKRRKTKNFIRYPARVKAFEKAQPFLKRMSNWQRNKWLQDGAKPDRAEHFSKLERPKRVR